MTEMQKLESKKYLPWVIGLIILLDAAFFRVWSLGHTSYWIDEMSSVHFAGNKQWSALFWDNSPPLYHFLLKLWIMAFGEYETATRSLSALFSTICTALWLRFGYKRQGLLGLILFGLAHAIYSLSVLHGRETRMYALFELACTNLLFVFVDIYEGRVVSKKRQFFSVLLALLTHALALLPVLAGFLFLYFRKKITLSSREKISFMVAALVVAAATFWCVRFEYLGWQQFKFQIEPSSHWPWLVIYDLFQGPWGLAAALFSIVLAFVAYQRRDKSLLPGQLWLFILALFIASTLAGFITSRSVFLSRYFLFISPIFIFTIVSTFLEFRNDRNRFTKYLSAATLLVFVIGGLKSTLAVLQTENPNWREAAEVIFNNSKRPKVYTTLPLSMRSPYFDAHNIEFEKLVIYSPNMFDPILQGAREGYETWYIANYWGFTVITSQINVFLHNHHCSWADRTVRIEHTEPVVLVQIFCPTNAE